MVALRLFLHSLQPAVVVGKLVQVSQCDLAGDERVVARDVRGGIVEPVLELDVHSPPELVDVEGAVAQSMPIRSRPAVPPPR
jgi:hypothetical protein